MDNTYNLSVSIINKNNKSFNVHIQNIINVIYVNKLQFIIENKFSNITDLSLPSISIDSKSIEEMSFLFNEINIDVKKAIDFYYDPYSFIFFKYCIAPQNGKYILIGMNKTIFEKFCQLIGHSGYMVDEGEMDLNITKKYEDEYFEFLENNPPILQRLNCFTTKSFILDINNKQNRDEFANIISFLSRGLFTEEEIKNILDNLDSWNRRKIYMLIISKSTSKNLINSLPEDLQKYTVK